MTFEERIAAIRAGLVREALDILVALHDGAHFIERPDPVMVLSGVRTIGPAAVVMPCDSAPTVIVTAVPDEVRARETCRGMRVVAARDLVDGLATVLGPVLHTANVGIAGLGEMPWSIARRVAALVPRAREADTLVFDAAQCKTDTELAHAREATRIAELGYRYLIDLVRPGISEDDLAIAVRQYTKGLGADDNFMLLSAGPHNMAIAPSNGRRLAAGDVIVAEITPSFRGQLVQICRTVVVGEASGVLREKYALVIAAMHAGIAAARPGASMAGVCAAVDQILSDAGYAEYCRPPHIRRRGHGLGFGSIRPGDVAPDNPTILVPDMLFMIHPNQYLPETGYLLCGEPVLITDSGTQTLTSRQAELVEVPI